MCVYAINELEVILNEIHFHEMRKFLSISATRIAHERKKGKFIEFHCAIVLLGYGK